MAEHEEASAATHRHSGGRKSGIPNWAPAEIDAMLDAINCVKPTTTNQWEQAWHVFCEKYPTPTPRNVETIRKKLRLLVNAGDPRAIQTNMARRQRWPVFSVPPADEPAAPAAPPAAPPPPADEPEAKRARFDEEMNALRADRKEMQATLNAILETVRLISTQLTQ